MLVRCAIVLLDAAAASTIVVLLHAAMAAVSRFAEPLLGPRAPLVDTTFTVVF